MRVSIQNDESLVPKESRSSVDKLLYLDVDGVLCLNGSFSQLCLANLKKICEDTKCKIVITSEWRRYDSHYAALLIVLMNAGIRGYVIGKTSVFPEFRPDQIKDNLEYFPNLKRYVIVDDIDLSGFPLDERGRFVMTNEFRGLTDEKTYDIIAWLNG